ncbi:hypothetical protein BT69DRAFT_1355090, partial [Atractiella rhizophila]
MQPTNHPAANSSKKKNKKKKGKASAQESSDSHPVTPNPTSPPTATAIPNGTPLGHEEEDTDPNHVYPTSPLSHAFPPHPDSLPSPPPNSPPLRFPLETIMSKLAQSPLVHTNPAHLLHTDGTPNFELLKTADELYRQIETAAKEALGDGWREKERGDIPMPKGVQMPRREGEEGDDESYWTSLPANWKSFIKSALPLAATINGYPATANGQAPPEGVDVAAATLARVVESNWSSLSSLQNPSEQEIALSLAIQQARDKRDQARKLVAQAGGVLPPLRDPTMVGMMGYEGDEGSEEEYAEFEDAEREGELREQQLSAAGEMLSSPVAANFTEGAGGKKKKKKKNKAAAANPPLPPPPPTVPAIAGSSNPLAGQSMNAGKQERERMGEFFRSLSEHERKQLLRVEKEQVLRKMREGQRGGCSCAVCGRKRSALEQELDTLYAGYYQDLERYADQYARSRRSNGLIPPPPGPGPFPGSVDVERLPPNPPPPPKPKPQLAKPRKDHKNPRAVRKSTPAPAPPPAAQPQPMMKDKAPAHHQHQHPPAPPREHHHHHHPVPHGNVQDDYDDEEDDEEEDAYDDEYDEEEEEEEEEDYDDDEDQLEEEGKKRAMGGMRERDEDMVFGITIRGDILTVADELLQNQGQKFLEMMESLAERRMQRERESAERYEAQQRLEEDEDDYDDEDEEGDEDRESDEEDDGDDLDEINERDRAEDGRR